MRASQLHSSPRFLRCLGSSGSIDISGIVGVPLPTRAVIGSGNWMDWRSGTFYVVGSPPYPGSTALRILLFSPRYAHFGPTILPFLASTLLSTHPLQSRRLALKLFHGFMSGWFSSEMSKVLNKNLDKLPRAVGDPFQSTPDLPLRGGKPGEAADDEPMMATVVPIELASSDLWQNHLNRSNFASCEKVVSAREGKRTALRCTLDTVTRTWSQYLCTPAKITAAIRRLEELQCLNIAEVVILRAWTGVPDTGDRDAWRLIGGNTDLWNRTPTCRVETTHP